MVAAKLLDMRVRQGVGMGGAGGALHPAATKQSNIGTKLDSCTTRLTHKMGAARGQPG